MDYIRQEFTDLNLKGQPQHYFRAKIKEHLSADDLVHELCHRNSTLNEGVVHNVLETLEDELCELLSDGYSITIGGMGTLRPSIGLRTDKEMDELDGEGTHRNARSLRVSKIQFTPNRHWVRRIDAETQLQLVGTSRLRRSTYTKEQRLAMAQDYLTQYGIMRVGDYAALVGLSTTKASAELREFSKDSSTGIARNGKKSALVYQLSR